MCGNFGLLLGSYNEGDPSWSMEELLNHMENLIAITMIRGAQSGGVALARGTSQPLVVKVVPGKRQRLDHVLSRKLRRAAAASRLRLRRCLRATCLGHTRLVWVFVSSHAGPAYLITTSHPFLPHTPQHLTLSSCTSLSLLPDHLKVRNVFFDHGDRFTPALLGKDTDACHPPGRGRPLDRQRGITRHHDHPQWRFRGDAYPRPHGAPVGDPPVGPCCPGM